MEEFRDERLSRIMSWMQAWARGYLTRKTFKKLQEQRLALTVVQRSLRRYLKLRTWPWWKLWQKVKPLLNASRVEDQIAVSILKISLIGFTVQWWIRRAENISFCTFLQRTRWAKLFLISLTNIYEIFLLPCSRDAFEIKYFHSSFLEIKFQFIFKSSPFSSRSRSL